MKKYIQFRIRNAIHNIIYYIDLLHILHIPTTHLHNTSIRDDNNNSNILQYNMNILNTSIIMYTTCRKSIIYLHVNPITLFYIILLSCIRGPLL